MIKKAIACLLIMMLAMMILETQFASSVVHHSTGHNHAYYEYVDPLYSNIYSECYHTTTPGASDNTGVGIGVRAIYIAPFAFDHAWWHFDGQYGTDDLGIISNMLAIDPCVNGYDHHYYGYYGSPSWDYINIFGYQYWCWRVQFELNPPSPGNPYGTPVYTGLVSSVEGSVSVFFYKPSDPPWPPYFGPGWILDAYTHNPDNDPNGNGWSYLHAHPYP